MTSKQRRLVCGTKSHGRGYSPWRTALVVLSVGTMMGPNNNLRSTTHRFSRTSSCCSSIMVAEALSITTFNVLASVHRSVEGDRRESERRDWWQPRAEGLARFVADELASSDVVLLQEWWFRREFEEIFDHHTGGIFDRIAEQRPGPSPGRLREDGMAVLVKKRGKLELLGSDRVLTGPQRIGQIVRCRERSVGGGGGRPVLLGNAHLSFPGGPDDVVNGRKQACEVQLVARALARAGRRLSCDGSNSNGDNRYGNDNNGGGSGGHMQIIAGDFNSDSMSLASTTLESSRHHFVNCMSAHAEQNLNSIGGPVSYGTTHHTHRGESVSVDQIFCRLMKSQDPGVVSKTSLRRLGGPAGTHVVDCRKWPIRIDGRDILSDHMPVTATLHWPETDGARRHGASNMTLHPLQSPWDS